VARVFITRELPGDAVERLRAAGHEPRVWDGALPPPQDELLAGTREAAGLLSLITDRVDAELLDGCPELGAISNLAVGYDNIDVAACSRRGIAVGNTPGVLTGATADLAFALILATARRLCDAAAAVREGRWLTWEPGGWLGADVGGAVLGIVGDGQIGGAVARRAAGFEMEVLRAGRNERPGRIPLDELLERSDFVSLHCPLNERTRGLIGAAELERMKPSAILINTARGEIVEGPALRAALESGSIAGAGLDVTSPEPLPADDPLLEAPNLIVLPHIGSGSRSSREAMGRIAAENLIAALDGRPMPNPVTQV
jgi:glyoxylate reductase